MTIWDFASEHWFVAIILTFIVGEIMTVPFRCAFRAWNRYLRSCNIRAVGWPPDHLDADGDWKPEPKEESEAA